MEKEAMSKDRQHCDPEAGRSTRNPSNGAIRLMVVTCIILSALVVLQTGETYVLKRRVEHLERVMLKALSSGHRVELDVVQPLSAGDWWEELTNLFRSLPPPSSSPPSSIELDTKSYDASETSNADDGTVDINYEQMSLESTPRRVRRSLEPDDKQASTRASRRRRNSGRHRTTTPASLSGDHGHSRRHRHDFAAYQLTMDVQLHGNDRARYQSGETVYTTFGEYGPRGFRPTGYVAITPDGSSQSTRLRPYRSWKTVDWARTSQLFRYIPEKGQIVVARKGLYFIYAQLLFCNAAARSGFAVMTDETTPVQLTRCWTSVDIVGGQQPIANETATPRFKTCYVGISAMLDANQQVWLDDLYGTHIKPDDDANVFGMIRMGDV